MNTRKEAQYKCIVCGKTFTNREWLEDFDDMCEQVDALGEMSLDEHQQVAYARKVCSTSCMHELN